MDQQQGQCPECGAPIRIRFWAHAWQARQDKRRCNAEAYCGECQFRMTLRAPKGDADAVMQSMMLRY